MVSVDVRRNVSFLFDVVLALEGLFVVDETLKPRYCRSNLFYVVYRLKMHSGCDLAGMTLLSFIYTIIFTLVELIYSLN